MKKIFKLLLILTILLPLNVKANSVINGNSFAVYNRTKQEIYTEWETGKIDYSVPVFTTEPSYTAPYKAGVVTDEYLQEVVDNLNYYRYLVGVPLITEPTTNDEALQKAEVIQTLYVLQNRALTHDLASDFTKPNDMSADFWGSKEECDLGNCYGAYAKHSIISYGRPDEPNFYFFDESIFDENYPENGHRMSLLSPEIIREDYGIGENTIYGRDTIDRNNYDNMTNSFAAYPSPGYFPKQDFADTSDWDIFLNIDEFRFLTAEEQNNVVVTIKNLTTDEVFTRTLADGNLYFDYICYGNMCTIYNRMSILQPDRNTTYYEDSYEVTVANLIDKSGSLVDLKYTVNFYDKLEGTISNVAAAEFTVSRIYYDDEYDAEFFDELSEGFSDIVLYFENGDTYTYEPDSYQISYYGTAGYGTDVYHAVPNIELPDYITDTNNVLSNMFITIQCNKIASTYKMEYNLNSYTQDIGDSITLSVDDVYYDRDGYIIYTWGKDTDETGVSGTHYGDGFQLDLDNLTKEDAGKYYLMVMQFEREADIYVYISKPFTVNINIPVESIGFQNNTMDMYIGDSEKLYPVVNPADTTSTLTWESSDSTIVSVDAEGNITANKSGSATITVSADGVSATVIVNVSATAKGDLNKNGVIDLSDVIKLLKLYLGVDTPVGDELTIGDMNNDNTLTLSDVIILLKTYLGIY